MSSSGADLLAGIRDIEQAAHEMERGRRSSSDGSLPAAESEEVQFSDLANARVLVRLRRDCLRYVLERKKWFAYTAGRWREDVTGAAERAAQEVARERLRLAADIDDLKKREQAVKWALTSQSEPRLRAMLKVAQSQPELALPAGAFDFDPYLLACGNGTLDLRTGDLRPHDPDDLIERGTSVDYDPDAGSQLWDCFLREVFADDEELVAFVRRAIGYSVTGDTREEVLFVCHGSGENGKGTLLEAVKAAAGTCATTSSIETFLRARVDRGPRQDLARLCGARMVLAGEPPEGHALDEATVKLVTGGDTICARFLYGLEIEFVPSFALWIQTNHLPRVQGDDDGIWRRILCLPFDVSFKGRRDDTIKPALRSEPEHQRAILAWAVRGCLEWQREGLRPPEKVIHTTAEYRQGEDILGAFLAEHCRFEGSVFADEFREAYENYCKQVGEKPLNASALGKRLVKRGIKTDKGAKGRRSYTGLSLADVEWTP